MRVDQNGPEREGRLLAPAHFARRYRQTIDYLLDPPAVSVQNRITSQESSVPCLKDLTMQLRILPKQRQSIRIYLTPTIKAR